MGENSTQVQIPVLIIVSPAKKLDYDTPPGVEAFTKPAYLEHSQELIDRLRQFSALDIAELMHLSMKLSELNFDRYAEWEKAVTPASGKQCVLAFKGDVYQGLDAESFGAGDHAYAQEHLRILSGLYGLLRPLDLMRPYRLEMGTRLPTDRGKNLYEFWGDIITDGINTQLLAQGDDVLVNLASNEYFKSVKTKQLQGRIITPQFKEKKNGEFKMIGVYAKKARGLLARYILLNRLADPEAIKAFDAEEYAFNPSLSKGDTWVFTRG